MDEFDELIAKGEPAGGDEFDELIAKGAPAPEAKPDERPWYERLANRIYDDYSDPAAAYERAARGVEADPEWQARAAAADQLGPQVQDIQSSPGNVAKFAGRTAAGLAGQYAGGLLGVAPVTSAARVALPLAESTVARAPALLGPLARGVNVAAPAARVGLGAAGGGVSAGTDAFAHGDNVPLSATGMGMLFGGGLTGLGEAAAGTGRGTYRAANRKLSERSYSPAELNDLRAEGGGAGVEQAGQELRDLGVTKPRGLLDWFRGNTSQRMSENSLDILNNARAELDRASSAVTDAPARDVSVISNDPNPVTVGQAPVDVSPVSRKLHSQADALDYAKNPDKAQTYRNLATELTTPAPVREPAPNASFEPVALESRAPETPDAPVSQLPLESRMPEQPVDPGALSSEPVTAPMIEPNAPPMSSQPMDDGNLLDVPPPTGPGEIDTTSHLARPYETSQANVSSEPLLDLEPPPSRAMKPGAIDANMSEQPVDTYQGVATKPAGRPLDLPPDDGSNLLLTPPDHAISNPLGTESYDQSYWPAPYEMSRNEPPMPPQEAPLPPARATVIEPTPRFKGDSQGPGLELDQPRQDFEPDNLLAPTALYPDNPPLPSGELAPPGMSRRAPIVGPIQHTGTAQGSRPPASNLEAGAFGESVTDPLGRLGVEMKQSIEPWTFNASTPVGRGVETGRFPETPRPMTPADPSTGFTLEQLMAMRRELGNQTRNFSGRPLNKVEGDMGAATRDAWKGAGDAVTGALAGHVEAGNLTPDIVDAYRGANKTFSTIADVNKNLAAATNRDFKAPSTITGGETVIGGGTKALAAASNKMTGLNAQYGIGKGLEAGGAVGSDLARVGAGLGWTNNDHHPQIEKAKEENPGAPKAEVEQKANDSMKQALQKAWYNVQSWF